MPNVTTQLAELATCTDGPGLTRLTLSPAHQAATKLIATWMQQAGLTTLTDAIGNVTGHNNAPGPRLILGSHIDTVRNAGHFDGNYGVIAAIEAARRAAPLPIAIEIIAFGDEEGVRFPQTLTGSRAIAGTFDPTALAGKDTNNITMAEALTAFGGNPNHINSLARKPETVLAYVETHIEQGPVLETQNLAAGIVTAINGASRFTVTITGAAGHAGTVPMTMRHDALAAAAAMILATETIARTSPDAVATVGTLAVTPGAPNSIPGSATFTIDLRTPADETRHAMETEIHSQLQQIADGRQVALTIIQTHSAPATPCAPWLQQQLATALTTTTGGIAKYLPSGAGHDAMAMAALCPVGMLFLRCKGGISHTPEEYLSPEDAETGVQILTSFLKNFRPES